jgi:hypothetical protein
MRSRSSSVGMFSSSSRSARCTTSRKFPRSSSVGMFTSSSCAARRFASRTRSRSRSLSFCASSTASRSLASSFFETGRDMETSSKGRPPPSTAVWRRLGGLRNRNCHRATGVATPTHYPSTTILPASITRKGEPFTGPRFGVDDGETSGRLHASGARPREGVPTPARPLLSAATVPPLSSYHSAPHRPPTPRHSPALTAKPLGSPSRPLPRTRDTRGSQRVASTATRAREHHAFRGGGGYRGLGVQGFTPTGASCSRGHAYVVRVLELDAKDAVSW